MLVSVLSSNFHAHILHSISIPPCPNLFLLYLECLYYVLTTSLRESRPSFSCIFGLNFLLDKFSLWQYGSLLLQNDNQSESSACRCTCNDVTVNQSESCCRKFGFLIMWSTISQSGYSYCTEIGVWNSPKWQFCMVTEYLA